VDVAEKLQQLAEMRRRGELTDAEFAMAKQATLESLAATAPDPSGALSPFEGWPNNFKKPAQGNLSFWKRYRLVFALFCVIVFIIVALVMLDLFNSTNSLMKAFPQELGSGNSTGQ
jgi:hypothetical protein